MIIPIIKKNIDDDIYKIFPKAIIIDTVNSNFQLDYLQIVNFHIYNYELKNKCYIIGYYDNKTYLINTFIKSMNTIYVMPLINNHYLHCMNNRGLKISYLTKRSHWYSDFDLLSFYINTADIDYYLQKLYHRMNFNITYDHFKEYLQEIITIVKANELLIHI